MSDCTFKQRITVKPSSHEFWPVTGWYRINGGFARLYKCNDHDICRRATVNRIVGGWTFDVREYTKNHGCLLVASAPLSQVVSQFTICWHAADLAACGQHQREVAL